MTRTIFCTAVAALALSGTAARADAINTANPGNVWQIEASARHGLTSDEVAIRAPVSQDPPNVTLNPTGTPVWIFGRGYNFVFAYAAATGTVTFKIDFDRNGAYEPAGTFGNEIATLTIPAFAGFGFRFLSVHLQGSSDAETVSNFLTINGVGFGSGTSGQGSADTYFTDTSGAFADIVATGNLYFFGNSSSENVPRLDFRLGEAVPVPEPGSVAILCTALLGIAAGRRRS